MRHEDIESICNADSERNGVNRLGDYARVSRCRDAMQLLSGTNFAQHRGYGTGDTVYRASSICGDAEYCHKENNT